MTCEIFYVQIQYIFCYKKPFTLKILMLHKEIISYQEVLKQPRMRFKKKKTTRYRQ